MLAKQASTFRSIDDLLQSEKDPQLLSLLFQKKKKLLALVQGGKITAQNYLLICKKVLNESTTQKIKDSVEMELMSADEDVVSWFKDVIWETKDKIEDQQKLMKKLGIKPSGGQQPKPQSQPQPQPQPTPQKKQQPPQPPPPKKQQVRPPSKKIQQNPAPSANSPINPASIYSLKVLDTLMEQNAGNKQFYMSLYEQKQKILQLINQKKINPQIYLQAIQKLDKTANNQDISFTIKMEIDQLNQFHEGKIQQWFKDRLQAAIQQKQNQAKKYNMFKTGKNIQQTAKKQNDTDFQVQSLTKDINKRAKNANINLHKQLFSFKFLDEQMERNENNDKVFCQLFEEKLKCLDLIKNGQVDAQGYRDILAQIIQETQNQQLKQAAQMEVDLHDITGDIMQFFQSAIQETGQKFQQQEKKYNTLTAGKGQKLNLNEKKSNAANKTNSIELQIQKQVKPNISDIVSFTVLVQFLQKYKKDYDYCFQLKQKGSKLVKLVQQSKLGPNQYVRFLEKKIQQSKQKQVVNIMKQQLKKFQQSNNPTKDLKEIVGKYIDKVKVNLGKRGSFDSMIQINQFTINEAQPKIKIEFLLRKLSRYESLFAFYKNNKLDKQFKDFQQQYNLSKKNTLVLCERIKNGDGNAVDLHQFVEKNIPNISFSILHRQSRATYNERLAEIVDKIKKSSVKLAQYTKQLKKGVNKNNIQEAMKAIQANNKTIAYLQSLKKQQNIPFPNIEQVKQQWYNLDLNKNLTQNQIQIKVTNIEGIRDTLIFKIFMIDRKHPRFQAQVRNGFQKNIEPIIKIPPQIMQQIIKGTQKRYLLFQLVSKGWFSESTVAEADLELNFIRSNRMQDKLVLKNDKIFMEYVITVKKPKKPIVTEILSIKVKQYPKYEHSAFIEKQFIKTIMPFQKPTQSELKKV